MYEQANKKTLSVLTAIALCVFASSAQADDVDDVMAFLEQYAALENDLEKQADMIRDDRVMIAGSARQTDQSGNMAAQIAGRDANNKANGGPTKLVMRIEAPEVRVYGSTAVASFMRLTNVYPANAAPVNPGPLWISLVLVKEGGKWAIAHTHISPVVPPN